MVAVRGTLGSLALALLFGSLAFGSIIALCAGGYRAYVWARRAPQFTLKAVTFRGLRHAQEADLLRMAGVGLGQNLFELEPTAIEQAMAGHPWVEEVKLTRRFPSSLSVSVKEHDAAAVVALGDLYLVDSEGRPFKKVQSGDPTDLPLITGLRREQFVEAPEQSRLRLVEALELARAYARSEAGRGSQLAEIRIGGTGTALVTAHGQEIRMSDGDPDEAFLRLRKVRAELEKRGLVAQVIHLENRSRPSWVAVKPSNGAAEKKDVQAR
jgi:cell division protein FtsQ